MIPTISPRNTRRVSALFALLIASCSVSAAIRQNQVAPSAPNSGETHETYRLRVENATYGRVEVSIDGGQSYTMLGRVLQSATSEAPEKRIAQSGVVLRATAEGIAFSVSSAFALKIRPAYAVQPGLRSASAAGRAAEVVTSLSSDKGIFANVLPPAGSRVLLQAPSHNPGPFPEGYSVSPTDSFVILVDLPTPGAAAIPAQTDLERTITFQHSLRALFESISADYRDGSIKRAVAEKRKVVAGTLTLRPNLPPDEPDPITAITYAIDDGDNVVCARTTAPYLFGWDTTSVPDGEHVVEVRGLSANGSVITRTRYLVVINNHQAAAAPHR